MRLTKVLAFVVVGLVVVASVQALEPAQRHAGNMSRAASTVAPGAPGVHDPAVFSDDCPATDLGMLAAAGGSFSSDMTGMTNVFECTDAECETQCYWYGVGGQDEIFEFTVEADGLWTFDTATVPAGWDTSLMILEGACPGAFVACDDDSGDVGAYESLLTAYLTAGTVYQIVVDDGQYAGAPGAYTVTYSWEEACDDDGDCDDGLFCTGVETCVDFMCVAGTNPCEYWEVCNDDTDTCDMPDPCIVYRSSPMGTGYMPIDNWGAYGLYPDKYGDDWYLEPGLGRDLVDYWGLFYMHPADYTAAYDINVELYNFATLCDGDYAVCANDGDCVGHGGSELCLMFNEPGAAIADTYCTQNCPDSGFCEITCTPTGAVALPELLWYAIGSTDLLGGPITAPDVARIGYTGEDAAFYEPNLGVWYTWGFSSGPANFLGEICATPVGACCFPDFTCAVIPEADCAAGGGVYTPSNLLDVNDCTDTDTDGVADLCDNCVDVMNADQADCDGDGEGDACEADEADQDMDGDGVCNGVDPCPFDNPDDSDLDGFCDSDDECVLDPMKSVPGQCGCGVGPMAGFDNELDTDGDGYADCIDLCPGIDNDLFPGCDTAIPTVSEWGLVILAMLLLVAGKVYFGRRETC